MKRIGSVAAVVLISVVGTASAYPDWNAFWNLGELNPTQPIVAQIRLEGTFSAKPGVRGDPNSTVVNGG